IRNPKFEIRKARRSHGRTRTNTDMESVFHAADVAVIAKDEVRFCYCVCTAKRFHNKAQGRGAHPGKRKAIRTTLKGLHNRNDSTIRHDCVTPSGYSLRTFRFPGCAFATLGCVM